MLLHVHVVMYIYVNVDIYHILRQYLRSSLMKAYGWNVEYKYLEQHDCNINGFWYLEYIFLQNHVSVLALSVVDRGFERQSGQSKDYKAGIYCFYAKHAAL
jgi:hypothetical protein